MNRDGVTYWDYLRRDNNCAEVIGTHGKYHGQRFTVRDFTFAQHVIDCLNKTEKDNWWMRLVNQYKHRFHST